MIDDVQNAQNAWEKQVLESPRRKMIAYPVLIVKGWFVGLPNGFEKFKIEIINQNIFEYFQWWAGIKFNYTFRNFVYQ